jgi:hypothetical protein
MDKYDDRRIRCDRCKTPIKKSLDSSKPNGWVQWVENEIGQYYGFKVTCHLSVSPKKETREDGCYFYNNREHDLLDMPISVFYDSDGMAYMLGMLLGDNYKDPGNIKQIKDNNEFMHLFMRFHLPAYEIANQSLDIIGVKGDKSKAYLKKNLIHMIENNTNIVT